LRKVGQRISGRNFLLNCFSKKHLKHILVLLISTTIRAYVLTNLQAFMHIMNIQTRHFHTTKTSRSIVHFKNSAFAIHIKIQHTT